jgi:3-oxo-5-alpha-steroid 4-dehydrogenase 1
VAIVLLVLWAVHYFHRSFVYPFRLHSSRQSMTVSIILMAAVFNVGNGYLNGRYLFFLGPDLQTS